jgi:DNA polymerase
MPVLHLDLETRSAISLDRVSTQRYARDGSTECLVAAFAFDDGPIEVWVPGSPVPTIPDATYIAAHNANFEFAVLTHVLSPRFGWPAIPIERFICTMAMARAAALPGKLDGAAGALGLETRKDKVGAKLMREIAARKREPTPDDLERLHAYCCQDVEVERELFRRLPPLIEPEQALWLLDHKINLRGIPIDRPLALAVADLAAKQRVTINAEIEGLTGGKITSANQRDRILAWISADGCEMSSLTKAEVKKALLNGAGDGVRKLLELRAIGSQAAASKVKTLLVGLDDDDRLRETLVFHGSAPGRWSGRRFQPQNLKKPAKTLDIDAAIAAIKCGSGVEAFGQPLSVAADVSRGLICARPGHVLIGADFSAIESRVLAWLAEDKKKLATYRAFDETGDPTLEPYCVTASKILGRVVTPADEEGRAIGKTADLALGFGGSVGAWRKLAPNDTRSDEEIKANVSSWRSAHPQIVRFWNALETALKRAIRRPGQWFTCGHLSAQCWDGTLWVTLPSGRSIAYPEAHLVDGKFEDTTDIAFKDNAKGQWREVTEWYGTFVENAVQATARDLLAAALVRLEAAGFEIVAHVHDEAIAEIPEGMDRQAEFLAIMTQAPPWADGLPIAGKVWSGKRFVKSAAAPPESGSPNKTNDANGSAHIGQEDEPMLARDPPPWNDDYPHGEGTDGPTESVFIYRSASGEPYLKVEKRKANSKRGKQYPQYHWTGSAWALGKPKGPKIPYRLPELFGAPLNTVIHIAEGEKDCETLAALGLVATTNSEGAKKGSWTADLNKWFVGRGRVFIPEDNDDSGHAFAKEKAKALESIVPDIRIVSFPEVPVGEDVTYWLKDLGHSAAEYLARCEASPQWKPVQLTSVCAAEVKMSDVTWLWPNRFALGKLGIIAGLPDEGKGQLANFIAARVTTGGLWPMGEGRSPIGNVVILQAEDGLSDTVVPRLAAAGADLSRVHLLGMVEEQGAKRMPSLQTDLELLRRKIAEVGDVKLVVIDPVSAYMGVGKMDSYRTTDVRAVLGPLVDLLEELGIAGVGIMHFNKKVDVTNALLRISDSLAFGAAARHVYGAIDDSDNGRKLLVRAKNNLACRDSAGTLAYRFNSKTVGHDPRKDNAPIVAPYVEFDSGYVDVTATEAMHAASDFKAPGTGERARTLLRDMLAGGTPVPENTFQDMAKEEDISWSTMKNVKRKLRIKSVRSEAAGVEGKGHWLWQWPDEGRGQRRGM